MRMTSFAALAAVALLTTPALAQTVDPPANKQPGSTVGTGQVGAPLRSTDGTTPLGNPGSTSGSVPGSSGSVGATGPAGQTSTGSTPPEGTVGRTPSAPPGRAFDDGSGAPGTGPGGTPGGGTSSSTRGGAGGGGSSR